MIAMADDAQHALAAAAAPVAMRLALAPENMEQDLSRLVLTLVEFLRRLLEAQAVRRMEGGGLDADEAERLGLGLMRAREAVVSLCGKLGIAPETLNLDLGPLGRLM
ncbi:gas vesicle protein K [Roseococcus thiosulfatophilus]|uniref:gas vesicle protein K n=1 Tax=Roseococcus thiosulfatophilus TaxID=35813 RepID=UPI001F5E18EE|nr:gas vesicle protein K [Roseococcus thiosulfatophilus]